MRSGPRLMFKFYIALPKRQRHKYLKGSDIRKSTILKQFGVPKVKELHESKKKHRGQRRATRKPPLITGVSAAKLR